MRLAYGNANGDASCVGYAYCYSSGFGYAYCYGNAYRQLLPRLHDGYYHWQHYPWWDRYWQPLRRLLHTGQSALPGERIWRSTVSSVCRVERRPAVDSHAWRQAVLLAGVCAGNAGSRRSVQQYPVPIL